MLAAAMPALPAEQHAAGDVQRSSVRELFPPSHAGSRNTDSIASVDNNLGTVMISTRLKSGQQTDLILQDRSPPRAQSPLRPVLHHEEQRFDRHDLLAELLQYGTVASVSAALQQRRPLGRPISATDVPTLREAATPMPDPPMPLEADRSPAPGQRRFFSPGRQGPRSSSVQHSRPWRPAGAPPTHGTLSAGGTVAGGGTPTMLAASLLRKERSGQQLQHQQPTLTPRRLIMADLLAYPHHGASARPVAPTPVPQHQGPSPVPPTGSRPHPHDFWAPPLHLSGQALEQPGAGGLSPHPAPAAGAAAGHTTGAALLPHHALAGSSGGGEGGGGIGYGHGDDMASFDDDLLAALLLPASYGLQRSPPGRSASQPRLQPSAVPSSSPQPGRSPSLSPPRVGLAMVPPPHPRWSSTGGLPPPQSLPLPRPAATQDGSLSPDGMRGAAAPASSGSTASLLAQWQQQEQWLGAPQRPGVHPPLPAFHRSWLHTPGPEQPSSQLQYQQRHAGLSSAAGGRMGSYRLQQEAAGPGNLRLLALPAQAAQTVQALQQPHMPQRSSSAPRQPAPGSVAWQSCTSPPPPPPQSHGTSRPRALSPPRAAEGRGSSSGAVANGNSRRHVMQKPLHSRLPVPPPPAMDPASTAAAGLLLQEALEAASPITAAALMSPLAGALPSEPRRRGAELFAAALAAHRDEGAAALASRRDAKIKARVLGGWLAVTVAVLLEHRRLEGEAVASRTRQLAGRVLRAWLRLVMRARYLRLYELRSRMRAAAAMLRAWRRLCVQRRSRLEALRRSRATSLQRRYLRLWRRHAYVARLLSRAARKHGASLLRRCLAGWQDLLLAAELTRGAVVARHRAASLLRRAMRAWVVAWARAGAARVMMRHTHMRLLSRCLGAWLATKVGRAGARPPQGYGRGAAEELQLLQGPHQVAGGYRSTPGGSTSVHHPHSYATSGSEPYEAPGGHGAPPQLSPGSRASLSASGSASPASSSSSPGAAGGRQLQRRVSWVDETAGGDSQGLGLGPVTEVALGGPPSDPLQAYRTQALSPRQPSPRSALAGLSPSASPTRSTPLSRQQQLQQHQHHQHHQPPLPPRGRTEQQQQQQQPLSPQPLSPPPSHAHGQLPMHASTQPGNRMSSTIRAPAVHLRSAQPPQHHPQQYLAPGRIGGGGQWAWLDYEPAPQRLELAGRVHTLALQQRCLTAWAALTRAALNTMRRSAAAKAAALAELEADAALAEAAESVARHRYLAPALTLLRDVALRRRQGAVLQRYRLVACRALAAWRAAAIAAAAAAAGQRPAWGHPPVAYSDAQKLAGAILAHLLACSVALPSTWQPTAVLLQLQEWASVSGGDCSSDSASHQSGAQYLWPCVSDGGSGSGGAVGRGDGSSGGVDCSSSGSGGGGGGAWGSEGGAGPSAPANAPTAGLASGLGTSVSSYPAEDWRAATGPRPSPSGRLKLLGSLASDQTQLRAGAGGSGPSSGSATPPSACLMSPQNHPPPATGEDPLAAAKAAAAVLEAAAAVADTAMASVPPSRLLSLLEADVAWYGSRLAARPGALEPDAEPYGRQEEEQELVDDDDELLYDFDEDEGYDGNDYDGAYGDGLAGVPGDAWPQQQQRVRKHAGRIQQQCDGAPSIGSPHSVRTVASASSGDELTSLAGWRQAPFVSGDGPQLVDEADYDDDVDDHDHDHEHVGEGWEEEAEYFGLGGKEEAAAGVGDYSDMDVLGSQAAATAAATAHTPSQLAAVAAVREGEDHAGGNYLPAFDPTDPYVASPVDPSLEPWGFKSFTFEAGGGITRLIAEQPVGVLLPSPLPLPPLPSPGAVPPPLSAGPLHQQAPAGAIDSVAVVESTRASGGGGVAGEQGDGLTGPEAALLAALAQDLEARGLLPRGSYPGSAAASAPVPEGHETPSPGESMAAAMRPSPPSMQPGRRSFSGGGGPTAAIADGLQRQTSTDWRAQQRIQRLQALAGSSGGGAATSSASSANAPLPQVALVHAPARGSRSISTRSTSSSSHASPRSPPPAAGSGASPRSPSSSAAAGTPLLDSLAEIMAMGDFEGDAEADSTSPHSCVAGDE